jgi:hypothetical protein
MGWRSCIGPQQETSMACWEEKTDVVEWFLVVNLRRRRTDRVFMHRGINVAKNIEAKERE